MSTDDYETRYPYVQPTLDSLDCLLEDSGKKAALAYGRKRNMVPEDVRENFERNLAEVISENYASNTKGGRSRFKTEDRNAGALDLDDEKKTFSSYVQEQMGFSKKTADTIAAAVAAVMIKHLSREKGVF